VSSGDWVFRVAVLASGSGSNLQAIIGQLHGRLAGGGGPRVEIALVVSDTPDAYALQRAARAGIPSKVLPLDSYPTREDHDLSMVQVIKQAETDLVVLAGYMHLVTPAFLHSFPWRVINLHPALLPAFPGTTSIHDALEYGVKVTGVTVHFVDEGVDSGPVIKQEPVAVHQDDTMDTLAARIHAVEHRLLPEVIRLIATGKVTPPLPGTRVVRID